MNKEHPFIGVKDVVVGEVHRCRCLPDEGWQSVEEEVGDNTYELKL